MNAQRLAELLGVSKISKGSGEAEAPGTSLAAGRGRIRQSETGASLQRVLRANVTPATPSYLVR